tara:strand:+ start:367 stop:1416 length:1050 start_codon:yes stop_codon:yes gene_type:complete
MKIKIKDRFIGLNHKPFIIAEMSGNHNQSFDRALSIVKAAADSGADAIKLQTYTPDTMTLDIHEGEFLIKDNESLWNKRSLYNLYQEAYTPWEWHKPIIDLANELGLICFSSPFDESAVEFLEDLNIPAYKIASFENTHIPLIKKVASTGKPIIISTGMADIAELGETISIMRKEGCHDIILLKCTSTYPADPKNSNILTIPHLRSLFNCEVGLSDHTLGIGCSVAAVAHGATVIEKHFTLSRSDGGVDSAFSLDSNEMKSLVIETERAWHSLGKINYNLSKGEKKERNFRRSIYISEDIKKGEMLTNKNIRIIRPGLGLAPKYYNIILGKTVNKDLKKGTPLNWELMK